MFTSCLRLMSCTWQTIFFPSFVLRGPEAKLYMVAMVAYTTCVFVFYRVHLHMYMFTPKPHTLTPSHPHILTLNPPSSHPHTPSHSHPHSGGTNYTITGTGLNSVRHPRLLFYMEGAAREGRRRRQTAGQNMNYIQSEVSMECACCESILC